MHVASGIFVAEQYFLTFYFIAESIAERFGKWFASLAGNLTDGQCLELTGYLGIQKGMHI